MSSKKRLSILDFIKKRNINRFSIFFGIAFIFLIFSKLSNDYNQTIKLKIQFSNLAEEMIIDNHAEE